MTNTERDLVTWLKGEVGFTFYPTSNAMTTPSGKKVELFHLNDGDKVDCSSYYSTIDTVDRIISESIYAEIPCTRPEACAAAWSVPDGAPISMAIDNIGCQLSDAASERMGSWARQQRSMRRKFG